MKRLLIVLMIVAAGCSGSDDPQRTLPPLTTGESSAQPGSPDDNPQSPDLSSGTPAPGATAAVATNRPGAAATAPPPPQPAPEGQYNKPRPGNYVYSLEGESSSPFQPNPQPYPSGSEFTVNVTASGNDYAFRIDDSGQGQTTVLRYEPNRVLLVSLEIRLPGQTMKCNYNPPIEIARLPVQPGQYPTQQSSGNNCSAKVTVRVDGQENVTVPAGTYKTWKAFQRTEFQFGSDLSGVVEGFNWVSPDLGTDLQTDQNTDATYRGSRITSHDITKLKTFPG